MQPAGLHVKINPGSPQVGVYTRFWFLSVWTKFKSHIFCSTQILKHMQVSSAMLI